MSKDGTKVSMVVKSLINDLAVEIIEPGNYSREFVIGKVNMLRYLVDTYMDSDARISDEELDDIWDNEFDKDIIAVTVI
jgi:hypothetical protein